MAVTVYAVRADMATAINPSALTSVDPTTQDAALADASRLIDSYLRGRYTLPLLTVGGDIKRACLAIAIYYVMVGRGYNPDAGGDPGIRDRYKDALAWLVMVSAGKATPDITDSASGAAEGGGGRGPLVISASSRGFSARDDASGVRWPFQGD